MFVFCINLIVVPQYTFWVMDAKRDEKSSLKENKEKQL